jgi:hypothetical protein
MPVADQYELEAPTTEEVVDREELVSLARWEWEMRGFSEDRPEPEWSRAEEQLRRMRLAAGLDSEQA